MTIDYSGNPLISAPNLNVVGIFTWPLVIDGFGTITPQYDFTWTDDTPFDQILRVLNAELASIWEHDPALLPDCPACSTTLPPDSTLSTCPKCGFEIDVSELIVAQRGPEALDDCYPEDPNPTAAGEGQGFWIPAEALHLLTLRCQRCDYDLVGMPEQGACPECGAGFDKREIVTRLLDSTD